jgi:phage terminase large subunit-like protein
VALDALIADLVKMGVLTAVKAKKIKGYSAIRNKALHAQWDDFDIRDVGDMIKGTREILEML